MIWVQSFVCTCFGLLRFLARLYPAKKGTSSILAYQLITKYQDYFRFFFHPLYSSGIFNLGMTQVVVNCLLLALSFRQFLRTTHSTRPMDIAFHWSSWTSHFFRIYMNQSYYCSVVYYVTLKLAVGYAINSVIVGHATMSATIGQLFTKSAKAR